MEKKSLLIDFCTIAKCDDGKTPTAVTGAKEAIQELANNEYEVSVFVHGDMSSEDVEKFLNENDIKCTKVITLPKYDILVAKDAVHASCDWKWTLESIVLHSPVKPQENDLKKQMHEAFKQYTKMAKKVVKFD